MYKATNGLRKDAIALSRGAYSAGARSALMRMRTYVRNVRVLGAPWRSQQRNKYKNHFHEMKRDRDGKSAKRSYSAVVVNDHMYPRSYIVFDPKGHRNMKKRYRQGRGYI